MSSLLLFPDELLFRIIYFLCGIQPNSRPESRYPHLQRRQSYSSNFHRLGNHVRDVINLSLTCSRFRELLGPVLYGFISLRRSSEIDSILSYPRRMDRWSDEKKISSEFDEILKSPLSAARIYRFVETLEISNSYIGKLHLFGNLSALKVLDTPVWGDFSNIGSTLTYLSINAETLLRCGSALPNLSRLDLIADIHALERGDLAQLNKFTSNLSTFNMFVTEPYILHFVEVLNFLGAILVHGKLKHFALREVRKIGERATPRQWEKASDVDVNFISSLLSLPLETVMVDCEFVRSLDVPAIECVDHSIACFTLVDPVISLYKLTEENLVRLAKVVEAFRPKEFALAYGEVIIQSHFQAFSAMQTFLSRLDSQTVTIAWVEKVWSVADDSLVRKHFEELIAAYDNSSHMTKTVANASFTDRFLFSTPRYRAREYFQVHYNPMAFVQCDASMGTANAFWEVETSLRDLEHYSLREKELSSIWV